MVAGRTRSVFVLTLIVLSVKLHAQQATNASQSDVSARTRRGLHAIEHISHRARESSNSSERAVFARQLAEVNAAMQNNARSPVPREVGLLQLPFVHYRYVSGRVGLGHKPASNLSLHSTQDDLSKVNPLPSTFWSHRTNIATADLATGFDRITRPGFEEVIWRYAKAKDGFGAHAGFEAKSGETRIKIKFGEIHSEPFTARLFHALGYNVDACDYSPGLKVKFDRRIFAEFNSRKPVDTSITAFGVLPVWTIHFQPEHDPFDFIASVILKDGTILPTTDLRRALGAGATESNLESRIDYLITVPANVQLRNAAERSIGPWDFGQLGHEQLRELRGAGLLAAWLGWFDSRFENTRLRLVQGDHGDRLKHVFSDVGGGLGKSVGWSGWRGESPGEFPDSFTEPEVFQGKGRMTKPFRIVNFRPVEPTPAFREMTIDDARWMARQIAELGEQQIVDALRASGFDEFNVALYRHKLLARRAKMLRDLGLN
jgi:hypothetical protein